MGAMKESFGEGFKNAAPEAAKGKGILGGIGGSLGEAAGANPVGTALAAVDMAKGLGQANAEAGTAAYVNRLKEETAQKDLDFRGQMMEGQSQDVAGQIARQSGQNTSKILGMADRLRNRQNVSTNRMSSQTFL